MSEAETPAISVQLPAPAVEGLQDLASSLMMNIAAHLALVRDKNPDTEISTALIADIAIAMIRDIAEGVEALDKAEAAEQEATDAGH